MTSNSASQVALDMAQAKEVFGLQGRECNYTVSQTYQQSACQRTLIVHLDDNIFTTSGVISSAVGTKTFVYSVLQIVTAALEPF